MILVALAAAADFSPPPGLSPDDASAALGTCAALFSATWPRVVDVDHTTRTLIARPLNGPVVTEPFDRCPAVAALPPVEDGALRCAVLPKGGFACKPIPGVLAAKAVVDAQIAAARPGLAACLAGRDSTWTVTFTVGPDGTAGDIDISVRGAYEAPVLDCLTNQVSTWKFGPVVSTVRSSVVLGP